MNIQQSPLTKSLRRGWLCLTLLVFIMRFFLLRDAGENTRFVLFVGYAALSWLPCLIFNFVEGNRLFNYLYAHHHKKYREFDTIVFGFNGFRFLKFFLSQDDLGDARVRVLKNDYKDFLKFSLTVFFALSLLFVLFML